MKFNWIHVVSILLALISAYVLYEVSNLREESFKQGRIKGAYDMLYSVQSKEVFLDEYSINEFKEWKRACEDKWKVDCGLGYFKIDGVGVYQVSPKQSD